MPEFVRQSRRVYFDDPSNIVKSGESLEESKNNDHQLVSILYEEDDYNSEDEPNQIVLREEKSDISGSQFDGKNEVQLSPLRKTFVQTVDGSDDQNIVVALESLHSYQEDESLQNTGNSVGRLELNLEKFQSEDSTTQVQYKAYKMRQQSSDLNKSVSKYTETSVIRLEMESNRQSSPSLLAEVLYSNENRLEESSLNKKGNTSTTQCQTKQKRRLMTPGSEQTILEQKKLTFRDIDSPPKSSFQAEERQKSSKFSKTINFFSMNQELNIAEDQDEGNDGHLGIEAAFQLNKTNKQSSQVKEFVISDLDDEEDQA